jgi:hypothetical protein
LGQHLTDAATINAALRQYVQLRCQARIIEAFGTVDYDPNYDYKAQRRKR